MFHSFPRETLPIFEKKNSQMITYGTANSDDDLRQILLLQKQNLPANISAGEARSQGFVTVEHDFGLLKKMNAPHPHIVARDGGEVIAYALVMLPSFEKEIPVLVPMFRQINGIGYKGGLLGESNYFVMGQVCVAKAYRGQGVFAGLYREMKKRMSPHFDYIITEVAKSNGRSLRAHEKVGFEKVHEYADGEQWELLLLALQPMRNGVR